MGKQNMNSRTQGREGGYNLLSSIGQKRERAEESSLKFCRGVLSVWEQSSRKPEEATE